MRQYAIITNLDSSGADRYPMANLPLHVTLLSIFFSEESPDHFRDILEDIARSTCCMTAETTSRALFGIDEDIPVTLVERTPSIHALHLQLLNRFSAFAEFTAPQFTGENFGPHITDQSGQGVDVGTQLLLDNLTLVEIETTDAIIRSSHVLGPAG